MRSLDYEPLTALPEMMMMMTIQTSQQLLHFRTFSSFAD
jgi:hypothetical protein